VARFPDRSVEKEAISAPTTTARLFKSTPMNLISRANEVKKTRKSPSIKRFAADECQACVNVYATAKARSFTIGRTAQWRMHSSSWPVPNVITKRMMATNTNSETTVSSACKVQKSLVAMLGPYSHRQTLTYITLSADSSARFSSHFRVD